MRKHILAEPSLIAKEHYGKASPEIRPAASLDTCSYCEHTGFTLHVKASCANKVKISVIEEQCVDPIQIVKNAQIDMNFSTNHLCVRLR